MQPGRGRARSNDSRYTPKPGRDLPAPDYGLGHENVNQTWPSSQQGSHISSNNVPQAEPQPSLLEGHNNLANVTPPLLMGTDRVMSHEQFQTIQ